MMLLNRSSGGNLTSLKLEQQLGCAKVSIKRHKAWSNQNQT